MKCPASAYGAWIVLQKGGGGFRGLVENCSLVEGMLMMAERDRLPHGGGEGFLPTSGLESLHAAINLCHTTTTCKKSLFVARQLHIF